MPLLMRYESWTCWWANKSTEYFHVNYCNYFTVIEQFWLWDCVYKYISSILLQCPCLFILHLPAMLRFDKRKLCVAKPMTTKIEISNLDRMKIESNEIQGHEVSLSRTIFFLQFYVFHRLFFFNLCKQLNTSWRCQESLTKVWRQKRI